jgi:hypothetical protein
MKNPNLLTHHPAPPPERRCKRMRRGKRDENGNRVQCNNWTLRGGDLCRFHDQRSAKRRRAKLAARGWQPISNNATSHLTVAYSKYLSESLSERMQSLSDKDLFDVSEEVKLARATVHDVAQFYDLALLAREQADTPEKELAALQACLAAGQLVRSVAEDVTEVAGKAVGAMVQAKALIGVQNIPLLVAQIVQAAHDEFGDDQPDRVKRLAERISEIRMPAEGAIGTSITPDMEAAAMDATVPRIARSEEASREEAA